MVVMNYTLQFLDVDVRGEIITRIFDGLLPGGLFLLSEKVIDEDPSMEELLIDLHHEHKRRNDYSQLEVSRKRAALENVLMPETVNVHKQRLLATGFTQHVESALQDEFTVKVYRDTAVVWFTLNLVGVRDGQRAELALRYTDVWVMRDGQWQCVSTQSTRVK